MERNRFSVYWKQVGPIVFGSFCLFIFDMCERFVLTLLFFFLKQKTLALILVLSWWYKLLAHVCVCVFLLRGVQLTNPFYSIWASDVGTELAVSFKLTVDLMFTVRILWWSLCGNISHQQPVNTLLVYFCLVKMKCFGTFWSLFNSGLNFQFSSDFFASTGL